MRVKYDYVTNSSSTSFCAWGIERYIVDVDDNDTFLPEKLMKRSYNYYLERISKSNHMRTIKKNQFLLKLFVIISMTLIINIQIT